MQKPHQHRCPNRGTLSYVNRPNNDERSEAPTHARGPVLPGLLIELIAAGQWRHPGDEVVHAIMPWFKDPVDLLTGLDQIRRESRALDRLADDESTARIFRLARGGSATEPVQLPWLDVDLAILIAVNRIPGDDVAIALDYRTSNSDPQVVAGDAWSAPHRGDWRTVAPTFSAFAAALNLPGHGTIATSAPPRSAIASTPAAAGTRSPPTTTSPPG
ncbi:hypothetical protein DFJ69_0093 [Thermomonospora umbrina]|uniref:Uncharacterized protein n=2 Tax=Thermomonospora umbrina TaxID=111806 RepID=A0A3D9SSQ6_9ACTN|nr:hypothetical protein DFJ69_0093 [Thermomonospora umbrina]